MSESTTMPNLFERWPDRSFAALEEEIRRYWKADEPLHPQFDGFARMAALAMLAEIKGLRRELDDAGAPVLWSDG